MDSQNGNYFHRNYRNIGVLTWEDQHKLRRSRVAIAGLGGVGGLIAERLVRIGVGHLKIADPETYQLTDINRQIGSSASSVGMKKASVFNQLLREINPELELITVEEPINSNNAGDFVDGVNLVINEIDTRSLSDIVALCQAAGRKGITVLQGAVKDFSAAIFLLPPGGLSPDFFFNLLCPVYHNERGNVPSTIAPCLLSTIAPTCSLAASFVSSEAILTLLDQPSIPPIPKFTMIDLSPPRVRTIDLSDLVEEWIEVWHNFYIKGELSHPKIEQIKAKFNSIVQGPASKC